jgi:Tol biopolymer transport system component
MRLLAASMLLVASQYPTVSRSVDITLTEGTSMAIALSPDGRWIAFDLIGRLWIIPSAGGEARPITPPLLEARQPTFSPDGRTIAFQGYDDRAWHIYTVDRDGGEPVAITSGEFDDREPAWAHSGTNIAFSSDRYGGITTIWIVDASNGRVRQLSKRDATMPVWSPNDQEITVASRDQFTSDGTRVVDGRRRPGLWGIGIGGATPERLIVDGTLGTPRSIAAAAWSADGRGLVYTTTNGQLWFSGRAGGGAGALDYAPFRPQWRGNTDILYVADGQIHRDELPAVGADGQLGMLRHSIIPFTARVTLDRASHPASRRELEPTARQQARGILAPVVAPNGGAIAFIALGDLWVMPRGQPPVRITDDEAVELDPTWSPDGRQIAYSSDRGGHMDLWIHDIASDSDTQVTKSRGAISNASWSPDGSHIACLVDRRSVVAVRVRPGEGRGGEADPGLGELGRPTWSADSRSVAIGALFPYSDRYREGLNQLVVHSFEGGSETPAVLVAGHSAGNRQSGGPVWSPDGTQMTFVSEGRLWNVGVDNRAAPTNQPYAIADDQPEFPSWESDSRHIVYETPAGFRRILSDGSIPETLPIDLQWTPAPPPPRVVVHAGKLVDGVFEGLRGESDIVIENGVIREVSGHRAELHTGQVVNAADETIMPGLIESHAHLDPDYGVAFGKVWLAYGITTVRIPAINPYAGLELREAIDSGRRPGPRLFLAGDPLDGVRVYYPGGVSVTSEDEVDRAFERAQALGMDFFKTYVRLPDRLQRRLVQLAHGAGKPVTSHELFAGVGFAVDGVEHLRGTSRRGYSPKASATNRAYRDVTDVIIKSGMTLTPTIGIQGAFAARTTGDRTLLFDPRLGLYPSPVVARLTDLASAPADPRLDERIKEYERTLQIIVAGGGKILAGTDAPIDPYGLGLHVELESYVHAGLTPFQALQTATVNAAQALGVDDRLGTIEPGKLADLAFVLGDPLTDIRAAGAVKRVMKGGRLYVTSELIAR